MAQVVSILKQNRLSVTESRRKILELFLNNTGALEHADIEKKAGAHFDRVTIYRTLQSFVEKGIIHVIPSTDNAIKYALCKDDCREGQHQDHHIHFYCHQCAQTFCLDNVVTPRVDLPAGYLSSEVDVVVKGICRNCAAVNQVGR